jgi:hypothetical protein
MARIIYSGLVTEIKGSIGGTTFQSNAYGYTIKNKSRQKKPKTVLQNQKKVFLTAASQAWRGLSQAQRDGWNAWAASNPQYAKNNPSAVLSGFAVFARVHFQYFLGTDDITNVITVPSYSIEALNPITFELENDTGTLDLNLTPSLTTYNLRVNIFISQPFKPSVNFVGSRVRFVDSLVVDSDSLNITNEYTSLYGDVPAVGDKVFVESVQYSDNNGIVYARQSDTLTVVAP